MNKVEVRNRALDSDSGEYVMGLEDTGSHASYLIYGVLKPGEKGRQVKPGRGHEEIVLAMQGDLILSGVMRGTLEQGSAFHIAGEAPVYLENGGDQEAVYIISGGHSEEGHHH